MFADVCEPGVELRKTKYSYKYLYLGKLFCCGYKAELLIRSKVARPRSRPQVTRPRSRTKARPRPRRPIINKAETDEKYISFMLQARGPGKCGLIIDLFTPNPLRSKAEIKSILKKNDCTFIEDGSVAFMFERKGVVSVQENSLQDLSANDKAEELAILVGAESVEFNNINNVNVVQFICDPLEFISVERAMIELHPDISVLSADVQYLAKSLIDLSEEHVKRSDLVIEALSEHPDVLTIYDNIIGYPSTTIKRDVIF
ncbi:translational activator of cytochrome c oxidase 1 isoform X3 [Hydra vulgaris]|uniref:Translational activator of cytochrome c oxidase 1 isoform X3 n=1 Tax=Hydra vulgaris TaxID=6087 RepID=A0ABM4CWM9_HYDVU